MNDPALMASITRISENAGHLEDVTLSIVENNNRIADILMHVIHARDGLITADELLRKLSKLLGVPFYDINGKPVVDGRDDD